MYYSLVSGWILFAIGMSQFPLWAMWYIWLHWNEGLWKVFIFLNVSQIKVLIYTFLCYL